MSRFVAGSFLVVERLGPVVDAAAATGEACISGESFSCALSLSTTWA